VEYRASEDRKDTINNSQLTEGTFIESVTVYSTVSPSCAPRYNVTRNDRAAYFFFNTSPFSSLKSLRPRITFILPSPPPFPSSLPTSVRGSEQAYLHSYLGRAESASERASGLSVFSQDDDNFSSPRHSHAGWYRTCTSGASIPFQCLIARRAPFSVHENDLSLSLSLSFLGA